MLIVGLGNPGQQYENTRHNAGWIQVIHFAKYANLDFNLDKKHKANIARGNFRGKTITLALPLTYMNLSGQSVQSIANYYKYEPEEILIVYDDKDFDMGTFKFRHRGSAGGHNGIKSIISCLGTESFLRFRIGIGPKPKEMEMKNFVLSKFSKSEIENQLNPLLEKGSKAIESVIMEGIDKTMQKYNRKDDTEKEN